MSFVQKLQIIHGKNHNQPVISIMIMIVSSRFHISEQKVSRLRHDHHCSYEIFCSKIQKIIKKDHSQAVVVIMVVILSVCHDFSLISSLIWLIFRGENWGNLRGSFLKAWRDFWKDFGRYLACFGKRFGVGDGQGLDWRLFRQLESSKHVWRLKDYRSSLFSKGSLRFFPS